MKIMSLFALTLFSFIAAELASAAPVIGVKNHKQLFSTMSVVTGIPVTNTVVSTLYKKIYRRLPENNDVASLSAPTLLSITTLAGGFCSELIKAEALLQPANRKFFGSVDFTKTQADFSAGALKTVVENITKNFWGYAATQTEVSSLTKSYDSAILNQPASADSLKKALLIPCVAALGSVEVYTQQ